MGSPPIRCAGIRAKAPEDWRTHDADRDLIRQVLECGSPLPLWVFAQNDGDETRLPRWLILPRKQWRDLADDVAGLQLSPLRGGEAIRCWAEGQLRIDSRGGVWQKWRE